MARLPDISGRSSGLLRLGAQDAALQRLRLFRQAAVRRADQERVEATIMLDGADAIGREPNLDRSAQHIGEEGLLLQVGQVAAARLVVRVADVMSAQNSFACEFAAPCHYEKSCRSSKNE